MTTYRARYLLTEEGVVEDGVFAVADGRFSAVHAESVDVDLGAVAVVPGLVNAHSHAFQRAIRGRTEYLDAARREEDFWSWRRLMYGAALTLDPDDIESVSAMAFLEMALTGITAVGEFHYVHHQPDGRPYDDPNALAHRVIDAARAVGIRITLLRVAYHRGGYQRPAGADQRRFVEPDVETYLSRVDALAAHWRHEPCVTVGMAPHSIRAVPGDWLEAVAAHADATSRVVHIHACEQRRELEESRAEYGAEPVRVLADRGLLSPTTTLVHGTHLDEEAFALLAKARPTVCACPTTERNLGDGFLPAETLVAAGVPIALGSDSQANIDLWAEMRLVEYHERLRAERRNVLAAHHGVWSPAPADGQLRTADVLWPMGTRHGARALGLQTGQMAVGAPADFVTLDLGAPCLAGLSAETLTSDLVFSTAHGAVLDTFVAGTRVVADGAHPDAKQIIERYRATLERIKSRCFPRK